MKTVFIAVLLCIASNAFSQYFEQFVFATQGNFDVGKNISISWTMGEPIAGFSVMENYAMTEGFQQPYLLKVQTLHKFSGWQASVYPNPAYEMQRLQIKDHPGNIDLRLFDMQGKLVMKETLFHPIYEIDTAPLASGEYLLHLIESQGRGFQILKIIKID